MYTSTASPSPLAFGFCSREFRLATSRCGTSISTRTRSICITVNSTCPESLITAPGSTQRRVMTPSNGARIVAKLISSSSFFTSACATLMRSADSSTSAWAAWALASCLAMLARLAATVARADSSCRSASSCNCNS